MDSLFRYSNLNLSQSIYVMRNFLVVTSMVATSLKFKTIYGRCAFHVSKYMLQQPSSKLSESDPANF